MEFNTEKIERYLLQTMSSEEKKAFEQDLQENPALRREYEMQRELTNAIQSLGVKADINKAFQRVRLIKSLILGSIIIMAVIITGAAIYLLGFADQNPPLEPIEEQAVKNTELPPQVFQVLVSEDTIIETNGGMILAIPEGAFDSPADTVQLQVQEALIAFDILRSGLSTTSNGELLQTAGMFSVRAFHGGEELAWKKELKVLVPTDEINRDMMLFDGEMGKDGLINWVNPQRLFAELQAMDMSLLSFYPKTYLLCLDSLGEPVDDREYVDSLYYSFSGYRQESILSFERDLLSSTDPTSYPDQESPVWIRFDSVSWENAASVATQIFEIDPSRIKAFWNSSFNKTLLATREFEERMRIIHQSGVPQFLEAYLSHLSWNMYQIDSLCMEIAATTERGAAFREKFREFYLRMDGGVPLATGLEAKLQKYYTSKQQAWKEASSILWEKHYKTLDSLRDLAMEKRQQFSLREAIRNSTVFREEFCRNLTDAYQQIGGTANCTSAAQDYYRVSLNGPGWKNLDQYVYASTANRKSMRYTDPVSGKTASLTYTPVEFSIENDSEYDRIFLYLIPDSLSSFQRVMKKDGVWKESLNDNLRYQFLVLAYKGDEVYWDYQTEISSSDSRVTLSLRPGTEAEIQTWLESRPASKAAAFKDEMDYRRFEIKESRRMQQVQKDAQWRATIARSIFPGMDWGRGGFQGDERE